MLRSKIFAATLLALTALSAPNAGAVALNLSITGVFDGDLNDQPFSGRTITFTGMSDTDTPDEVFDEYQYQYQLTSLPVKLDGTDHQVTKAAMFFIWPLSQLAGIVDPDTTKGLVRFSYGRGNSFYSDAQTRMFSTSVGPLLIRAGTNIAISGVSIAAVPEPATWGLMVLGFVSIGTMIRRRRRPSDAAIASIAG